MAGPTVLVVDDDSSIAELIRLYLSREGYEVLVADNGRTALELARRPVDLIILDIMLPELDGREVCRQIRADSDVPIIMLSARGEKYDRIVGLDLGADDYVAKPFDPGELLARVRAVMRRTRRQAPGDTPRRVVEAGDLVVDRDAYRVTSGGRQIPVTPRELELLYHLMSDPGRVFTRDNLLNAVWGYDFVGDTRTVDAHIKRLRAKLGNAPGWRIATVWGVGYRFEVSDS